MLLIITLQELELIHIILYLQKKTSSFHDVIILIKSVVNKIKTTTTLIHF